MKYMTYELMMLKYDERVNMFFENLITFAIDNKLMNESVINWDVIRLMTKDIISTIFEDKNILIFHNTFIIMKDIDNTLKETIGTPKYDIILNEYMKTQNKRDIVIKQFDIMAQDIIKKIINVWFPFSINTSIYNIDIEIVIYMRKMLEFF